MAATSCAARQSWSNTQDGRVVTLVELLLQPRAMSWNMLHVKAAACRRHRAIGSTFLLSLSRLNSLLTGLVQGAWERRCVWWWWWWMERGHASAVNDELMRWYCTHCASAHTASTS